MLEALAETLGLNGKYLEAYNFRIYLTFSRIVKVISGLGTATGILKASHWFALRMRPTTIPTEQSQGEDSELQLAVGQTPASGSLSGVSR